MLLFTHNIPERKRYLRITIPERKNIQLKVTERAGDTTGVTSVRCYTNTSVVNRPVLNFSRTDGTVPRPSVPSLLNGDGMTTGDREYIVLGRQKVISCSIWLDMSEPTVMDRVC